MLSTRYLLSLAFLAMASGWSLESTCRRTMFESCRKSVVAAGASFLLPVRATAYERRDVGDPKTRSPSTAAMNEQAYQTNNRLEASGFKLDTREEEQARLSSAMASFSYEASTTPNKKTGFRPPVATKDTKSK
jgi:hypothetical protein